MYYYVGSRFLEGTSISGSLRILFWVAIFFLILLTPVSYFFSLFLEESEWQKSFSFIAFTSLGFLTILFSLVLIHDLSISIVNGFQAVFAFFRTEIITDQGMESSINRKDFFLHLIKPSLGLISISLTGYGVYKAVHKVDVKRVDIPINDLHPDLENFKIVQISDIHIGPTIKKDFLEEVVRRINVLQPDIIAITGDLVDGSVYKLKHHLEPLKNLKSKYGSFFVTGNHEYYSGVLSWLPEIRNLGIHVLLNQNHIVNSGEAKLLVGGVTDYKAHTILPSHASDPEKAILSKEKTDFKLLLAHQPNSVFEAAIVGFDLQLSGHTHGGQYFPGNLLIHLFQKFVAGLYKHGDIWLYVSSGTGYWGPPIRIGAPAEITEINLKRG